VSGGAPEILEALVATNAEDTAPYGADPATEGLQSRFAELFETDVEVYPVGSGTAANGLCASSRWASRPCLCTPNGCGD
jgi:threonine aldolase